MNWTESYSVMNDVANSVNEPDEGESELGIRLLWQQLALAVINVERAHVMVKSKKERAITAVAKL